MRICNRTTLNCAPRFLKRRRCTAVCAPRVTLRFGDFEIASEIFAVRHLPGDFFTVQQQHDGVVFALGDICGKGLAAGMWTTHLVGLLGARMAVTTKPEGIVAGVNRDICLLKSFMPLASLFIAKLDPKTGVVKYCSAGHPPAFSCERMENWNCCRKAECCWAWLLPLPTFAVPSYSGEGDVLMVYSDGITESQNCAGEEFGYGRLEDQLRRAAGDRTELAVSEEQRPKRRSRKAAHCRW